MPYAMNQAQFDAVVSLPAQRRYAHFVSMVADSQELWTLRNSDGFVLSEDDAGSPSIPIWPHPDYASALVGGPWADCTPARLDLDAFLSEWIPGASGETRTFAVFPTPDGRGVVVAPDRLRDDLQAESQQYE